MKIHLIAIGGAAMHNLALALQYNHHTVSGSDDEIYNPAYGRLEAQNLLPEQMGWHPERITSEIDIIILGMHARPDNPELAKAKELGLEILSYPAFIFKHAQEKKRYVIGGSHGKTTTTAMVLHVLNELKIDSDYLVGAQLEGFDNMVRLSDAPRMVIEGDEYLSSPLDRRPKLFHYHPQYAVLTGIAWDHINVFPTFEIYVDQFRQFLKGMEKGKIFYFSGDDILADLIKEFPELDAKPYMSFATQSEEGELYCISRSGQRYPVQIFGEHNFQNLSAAFLLCQEMGVTEDQFLGAIGNFTGAAKRLQLIKTSEKLTVYQDFAHAPSKVAATVKAVRAQFPDHKFIAALELHTFSSLNKDFIPEYKGALDAADAALVFYQDHTLEMKKLPSIDSSDIKAGFQNDAVVVCKEQEAFKAWVSKQLDETKEINSVVLLMTSGTFGGSSFAELAEEWGR